MKDTPPIVRHAQGRVARVDPELIRRHLELTPAQRLRRLEETYAFACELARARAAAAVVKTPES
jgi:hypothetical protein